MQGNRNVPISQARLPTVPTADVFAALASDKRLQVLEWLKDPRAHFPPQKDGDLVKDGVCVVFIARKLGVAQPTATTHLQTLARAGARDATSASASGPSTSATKPRSAH